MRRAALIIVGLLVLGGVVFAVGPSIRVDLERRYAPRQPPPSSLDALDEALATHEKGPIVDGAEKRILWHDGREETPLALVYLHGFSASRQEVAPFMERLGTQMQANVFETRLAGHGRKDDALGEATAHQWLEDLAEAMAVASMIGERTVLVGTSTGGTLASLALRLYPDQIAALVLISPNFGVRDPTARVLELPWSHSILPHFIPTRSWEPANAGQAKYWTHEYRTPVLFHMQALVRAARGLDFERMTTPALFLFSPDDDVVSVTKTREVIARWPPALREAHEITVAAGRPTHVIAGDILNPEQTEPLVEITDRFLRKVLELGPPP